MFLPLLSSLEKFLIAGSGGVCMDVYVNSNKKVNIKNKLLLLFLNEFVAARWCYIQRVVN